MITPAIDIPRLSDRIQEIVQTYDPSVPEKNYTIKDPNTWNNKELIRNLIRFAKAFHPEAWKASGLRMETPEALANFKNDPLIQEALEIFKAEIV